MPIQHAMNFIKDAGSDRDLRRSLYSIKAENILDHLEDKGYKFSIPEFEESISLLHVKCESQEQADELFEVVWWFKMMYR